MSFTALNFYTGELLELPAVPGGRDALQGARCWLKAALGFGAAKFPGHPAGREVLDGRYSAIVDVEDGLLRVAFLAPQPSGPHRSRGEPILTMFVASGVRADQGAQAWSKIVRDYGGMPALRRPAGPWATRIPHTGADSLSPAAIAWTQSEMRQLSWAWVGMATEKTVIRPWISEYMDAQDRSRLRSPA